MQKFNYHCHTSFKNIFDGHSSAEEMLFSYKNKGFIDIGISNHCICHPSIKNGTHSQMFNDVDKFLDVYKESFDYIDEAASKNNMKVRKGLEVDYFPSLKWNKIFEFIPIESQIILIVDSYCALIEKRPYRPALSREDAIETIMQDTNSKRSARLASEFAAVMKEDMI